MKNIPVVILAGGLGTRLREQTEFMPKPMVPIGSRPILWHIMKLYSFYGFRRFILCLGYKSEVIKEYFFHYKMRNSDFTINLGKSDEIHIHNTYSEEDWVVTLAETGLKAMTGARIKQIEKHIQADSFLLTYGDGVADVDIKRLYDFHLAHGKLATVTGVNPPSRFGELIVEGDSVVKFGEKPQVSSGIINGGFFVFCKDVFRYLNEEDDCTLEREPLEKLARDKNLMVYRHDGFWQCMDTLRDMNLLNEYWQSGAAPWKIWNE